jgi:hypothetical protein
MDTAAGNYRLCFYSDLIDKGGNNFLSSDNTQDADGKPRVFDGIVDIGAYEFINVPVHDGATGRIYINKNFNGDGSSWANPLKEFAVGLKYAETYPGIREIWVAGGTYFPKFKAADITTAGYPTSDKHKSFVLVAGVRCVGGFAGGETDINQRTGNDTTILSGDIGAIDDITDNCYHVVISSGLGNSTAAMDGFFIKNGNANDNSALYDIVVNARLIKSDCGGGIYCDNSSLVFSNLTIQSNEADYQGGGIFNNVSSSNFTNVTIHSNKSFHYGGGMYNVNGSSPKIQNSEIYENIAIEGGGVFNNHSDPVFSDVAIHHNSANSFGGGICNNVSSPILTDVIISKNTAGDGGGMSNDTSSPVLYNVIIDSNTANSSGGGIFNLRISSPILENVSISSNTANNGGGFYNASFSSPVFRNTKIFNNTANFFGGGLYSGNAAFELSGVSIQGNKATQGGGIYVYGNNFSIYNVLIANNKASDKGGGLYQLGNTMDTCT